MSDDHDDVTEPNPTNGRSRRWTTGVIGLLLGLVIGAGAFTLLDSDDSDDADAADSTSTTISPAVADAVEQARLVDEFLDAWFRYRSADLVIEWSFARVRPDEERLDSTAVLVQRPPDRLYGTLGSVSGVVGGELLNCDAAASEEAQCVATEASGGYEERIRSEQRTRSLYFIGSPPLYRLADDGPGCYSVIAAIASEYYPWGRSARFCFDAATGALIESVMEFDTVTETLVATSVRDEVSDADFEAALPGS